MNTLLSWLSRHKRFTLFLIVSHFAISLFCHDLVSSMFLWLQDRLTRPIYNAAITGVASVSAILLSVLFFSRLFAFRGAKQRIFYWCMSLGFVIGGYNMLMCKNVESIHFPQYAILVVPVFALTRNFGMAFLWVTLLGALDEAYQYLVLHATWMDYYDFNDVILNAIGAGLGVTIVYSFCKLTEAPFAPRRPFTAARWVRSPAVAASWTVALAVTLLRVTGLLVFSPMDHTTIALVSLSRVAESVESWIHFPWGKTYHILGPIEGTVIVALMAGAYALMDFGLETEPSSVDSATEPL